SKADGRLADGPVGGGRRRRGGDVAGPGLGPAPRTARAARRLVAGPAAGPGARRPQPAGSAAAEPRADAGVGRRLPPPNRRVAEQRPHPSRGWLGGNLGWPGHGPAQRSPRAAGRLVAGPAAGPGARRPQPEGTAPPDRPADPRLGADAPS